jgi:hypothetical protein
VTAVAALAEARPDAQWSELRDRLVSCADLLHETFAVGASLLTTQRGLDRVDGYSLYDRYDTVLRRLMGAGVHPWDRAGGYAYRCHGLHAVGAWQAALMVGIDRFDPTALARSTGRTTGWSGCWLPFADCVGRPSATGSVLMAARRGGEARARCR